jgi:hypothetical protein
MQVPRAPGWHIVFATAGLYNLLINHDWMRLALAQHLG